MLETLKKESLFIRLSNGKYVDLLAFTKDNVDLFSVERSLNNIKRFTGHYKDKQPLTVAQHSKLCVRLAEMLFPDDKAVVFDCLIHDMPESITGDLSSPTKKILGEVYKPYEERIEEAFYAKLWIIDEPFTTEVYQNRKICDLISLDIERRAMWNDKTPRSNWPEIPMENAVSLQQKRDLFDWAQGEASVPLEKMYNEMVESNKGKDNNNKIPVLELDQPERIRIK